MKVYLAVPIVANRDIEKAETIANVIRSLGHETVSSWVLGEDPGLSLDMISVFERDLGGVRACDVLVAEVSYGSHGVGMEVMAAYFYGKRILLLFDRSAKVSHMLLGVPKASLISYASSREMVHRLRNALGLKT